MNQNYLKISTLIIICSLACFSFILGCKNAANPLGPYDVPTATPTYTNTPTNTATVNTPTITDTATATYTPQAIFFNVTVTYLGNGKTGVPFNVVDPSGNTLGTSTTGSAPVSIASYVYGNYSVNIPTNNPYSYSSTIVNVTGPSNYNVPFVFSNPVISANPTNLSYQSAVGYQIPVTVSYSSVGNLNVPVSIVANGLPSAFVVTPTSSTVTTGNSTVITVVKNTNYFNSASLNFFAFDFVGTYVGTTAALNLTRGYTIPVTITIDNNLNVWSDLNGPFVRGTPVPAPTPQPTPGGGSTVNSDSVCTLNFSYDPTVAGLQGVTITGNYVVGSDGCNQGVGNCSGTSFTMIGNSTSNSATWAAGFYGSLTTPYDPGTWNFTVYGPTGTSNIYSFSDNGCNGGGSCSNSTVFWNNFVIAY